jgi:hypothetical protein
MMDWIIPIAIVVIVGGGGAALLAFRLSKRKSQNQFVSKGASGIQSGRDTNIKTGRDTNPQ